MQRQYAHVAQPDWLGDAFFISGTELAFLTIIWETDEGVYRMGGKPCEFGNSTSGFLIMREISHADIKNFERNYSCDVMLVFIVGCGGDRGTSPGKSLIFSPRDDDLPSPYPPLGHHGNTYRNQQTSSTHEKN